MEIKTYINKTFEEEGAMTIDGEVVLQGDYYHNRITDQIEGALAVLNFLKIEYTIELDIVIAPNNPLFQKLRFYDDPCGNYTEEDE